jgi:hypothetical protein
VEDHDFARPAGHHVQLDAVGAVSPGARKGREAVLAFDRARPPMSDDERKLRVPAAAPHGEKRTISATNN